MLHWFTTVSRMVASLTANSQLSSGMAFSFPDMGSTLRGLVHLLLLPILQLLAVIFLCRLLLVCLPFARLGKLLLMPDSLLLSNKALVSGETFTLSQKPTGEGVG